MMTFYQPSPLEYPEVELRLAILYSAKQYCSVHCDLVTITPDLLSEYGIGFEALSYCWGKDVATKTIFIDGLPHQVTPNLEHALRHLRSKTEKRIIWIDAICINQQDVEERNKQVPRMGWIYSNATEVLIWIGRDNEKEDSEISWDPDIWPQRDQTGGSRLKTDIAFQFLENLAWFSKQTLASNPNFFHLTMLVDMCKNVDNCANISRLLRRKWFERVWVIQEVVLARKATVVCGYRSIPWSTLVAASKGMVNAELMTMVSPSCPFFSLIGQHRISRIEDCVHKRQIFPLLEATQASKFPSMAIHATDARDKLYGLLGLMSLEDKQDVEVDYSLSVVDVYKSWVQKRLLRTGQLDVLTLCANTGRRGFPSWVPDLNHRLPLDLMLFSITHSIRPAPNAEPPTTRYTASGSALAFPKFSTEITNSRTVHVLHLQGFEVDTIEFIVPKITPELVPLSGDIQDILDQLENMLIFSSGGLRKMINMSSMRTYEERRAQLQREFATTLIRGYKHANITCSLETMYECFRGRADDPSLLPTSWPPTHTQEFYANFGMYLRNFLWLSRFFVSSLGYFGVVSDNCNVAEGDQIWILKGGKTPFILRQVNGGPLQSDRTVRELLGSCYLNGCMDGQLSPSSWNIVEELRGTGIEDQAQRAAVVRDVMLV